MDKPSGIDFSGSECKYDDIGLGISDGIDNLPLGVGTSDSPEEDNRRSSMKMELKKIRLEKESELILKRTFEAFDLSDNPEMTGMQRRMSRLEPQGSYRGGGRTSMYQLRRGSKFVKDPLLHQRGSMAHVRRESRVVRDHMVSHRRESKFARGGAYTHAFRKASWNSLRRSSSESGQSLPQYQKSKSIEDMLTLSVHERHPSDIDKFAGELRDMLSKSACWRMRQATKAQCRLLLVEGFQEEFRAGQPILTEGTSGQRAYLLLTGKVQLQLHRMALRVLGVGEVFGELGIQDGSSVYKCSAHVVGDSVSVLAMSASLYNSFIESWSETIDQDVAIVSSSPLASRSPLGNVLLFLKCATLGRLYSGELVTCQGRESRELMIVRSGSLTVWHTDQRQVIDRAKKRSRAAMHARLKGETPTPLILMPDRLLSFREAEENVPHNATQALLLLEMQSKRALKSTHSARGGTAKDSTAASIIRRFRSSRPLSFAAPNTGRFNLNSLQGMLQKEERRGGHRSTAVGGYSKSSPSTRARIPRGLDSLSFLGPAKSMRAARHQALRPLERPISSSKIAEEYPHHVRRAKLASMWEKAGSLPDEEGAPFRHSNRPCTFVRMLARPGAGTVDRADLATHGAKCFKAAVGGEEQGLA
eukprot:g2250.t1